MIWIRRLLITLSLLVALLVVGVVLLFVVDLGRFKSNIQDIVSDATGREFAIGGQFELNVGGTIELLAEDVRLGNADWGTAENILDFDRVVASVDTWSLVSGPIDILALEIDGLTLHVEKNPDTLRSSWAFGDAVDAPVREGRFHLPLLLRQARLSDVAVTYGEGWLARSHTVSVSAATVSEDESGLLQLELDGAIDSDKLRAEGLAGPLSALIDGRNPRWELQASIGEFLASTEGTFADLFSLEGPRLRAVMLGPSAENVLDRLGLPPLARGPVDMAVEVSSAQSGIEFGAEGAFGNLTTDITGSAQSLQRPGDLDLSMHVSGPNLQGIGALFGAGFLPATGFAVKGDITIAGEELDVRSVAMSAGEARLELRGRLAPANADPDARLNLSASGPEVLDFLPPKLASGIPSAAFEIQATAAGALQQPTLQQLSLSLGEDILNVELDEASIDLVGLAKAPLAPDRHSASIAIRGQDLEVLLEPWVDVIVPATPFAIDGMLSAAEGALQLSNVTYRLDQAQGTVNGTTGRLPSFDGLRLETTLAGPDASRFIEVAGDPESGMRLPADAFETRGVVAKTGDGWVFGPSIVRIGESRFEFGGSLGDVETGTGVDIDFTASGPDLRRFLPGWNVDAPVPFTVGGGMEIGETHIELREIDVRLGETTAWLDGRLPTSIEIVNAEFDVRVAGPNLQRVGRAFDIPGLPASAFRFEGGMDRSGRQYVVDDFIAVVGDNDLTGDVSLDMRAKPLLIAQLDSERLNLAELLGDDEQEGQLVEEVPEPVRLIPDTPLPLHWLDVADLDLTLRLQQLDSGFFDVGSVELRAIASNDELHVETSRASLTHGGTLTSSLDLVRTAGDRADVRISAVAREFRFRPPFDRDGNPIEWPTQNFELELLGSGATFRDLAAGANGTVNLRAGAGELDSQLQGFLLRDFLAQLLSAINPMAREAERTRLNCGFLATDVVDGLAETRAFGFQTDQLAVASIGTINLATEEIDLSFRVKQREGVGVSLAGVINPYIKVGGTLASPALEIDARRGLVSGTIAVMTGGLSILAKGVWDRYLSRDDYCEAVLEALEAGEIPTMKDESDEP